MSTQTLKIGNVVYPSSTDENFQAIEAALFANIFASMTTGTTPASGTCAVQFALLDGAGDALASVQSGIGYLSDANGVMVTAATSVATLTNGSISTLVTGQVFQWICKADGTLGVTLTAAAASYYISLVLPNGKIITSDEIVVSA